MAMEGIGNDKGKAFLIFKLINFQITKKKIEKGERYIF